MASEPKMDPQMVREWKANYDAHNEFVLEEIRNKTAKERFDGLVRLRRRLALIRPGTGPASDWAEHAAWSELQEKWLERNR